MDERDAPDVDPGTGYVTSEPAFATIRGLIRPGQTVLDIGCGHGNVGAFFAQAGAIVDGIEPDPDRAAVAANALRRVCARTLADAIGSDDLQKTYDVVTMLDVVEHVPAPQESLRQASSFMTEDSRLFLFVPNSAHWSFRKKMVRGDWTYEDWGLFDRTHLRFFDLASAERLYRSADLVETRRWFTSPGSSWKDRYGPRLRPKLMAFHFLFELKKA